MVDGLVIFFFLSTVFKSYPDGKRLIMKVYALGRCLWLK